MPTTPRRTNSDTDNLEKDARESGAVPVGYVDEEGGQVLAVQGDADAPYVIAHGRASANGVTGLTFENDGAAQRIATTEYGHVWVNLFVNGADVSTVNPMPVTIPAGFPGAVDIVQVAGVVVAPVTPGVLPVEVTQPLWTKVFAALGANGDLAVVPAGAGRLQRLLITIYAGNALFLHICDKAAAPPTAATRLISPVPFPPASAASPSYIDISFDDVGALDFVDGLVVGLSTTGATYTVPAGATGEVTAWWL